MDHKKNYVQLYNGIVKASDFLADEDVRGFIQIGILLESLKCIIQIIDNDLLQNSEEQSQETQEEIDKYFGRNSKNDSELDDLLKEALDLRLKIKKKLMEK